MAEKIGVVFDLDGTLYMGGDIIPGAAEAVLTLRRWGASLKFVTNNPRKSRDAYAQKLCRLGVEAHPSEVVTSANLMVSYLQQEADDTWAPYLLLGERQLQTELEAAGFPVVESSDARTVVVSFDTTLDYAKWTACFRALRNGARFVATNPDVYCPTPDGGLPDAGMLLAGLEKGTGRTCSAIVGKPSSFLADYLLRTLLVSRGHLFMVGDRPETDMLLARRMQAHPVLVDTGVPKLQEIRDAHRIPSVAALPDLIQRLLPRS